MTISSRKDGPILIDGEPLKDVKEFNKSIVDQLYSLHSYPSVIVNGVKSPTVTFMGYTPGYHPELTKAVPTSSNVSYELKYNELSKVVKNFLDAYNCGEKLSPYINALQKMVE